METLNLNIYGLFLNPNPFSEAPPGGLKRADNVVIDRESVADSRRGQSLYGALPSNPLKIFDYQSTTLVHYSDTIAADLSQNGTYTAYSGSYDAPSNTNRIRQMEASLNLYLTTDAGIKKLDRVDSQFTDAGGIKALDGTASLTNAGGGFMATNTQVAYRMTWSIKDDNDNTIQGSPSPRLVIANGTGKTADVSQTWYIPDGVTTDHFYRIYRSTASASSTAVPDDEMQQVLTNYVTSADITAGYFTATDNVPNALRGATLYTSPSQEGILQANEIPPISVDALLFKGYAFYFNTINKNRYSFTLLAVGDNTLGGSFGYQTNTGALTDTDATVDGLEKKASIIIQDLTYTADTVGVAGNSISIEYTGGATAGAEVVSVTGSRISVQIQDATSTATQVKTAVDASGAAAALVDVAISGSGANAQTITAQTFLADGFNTSFLNVGMRIVGAGVPAGTTIASITDSNTIEMSAAATATATNALEFQDRFSIDAMNYWAASSSDFPNRQFLATLTGTAAENIEDTALTLIQAINQDPNNTSVYAYYQSSVNQIPGMILIEERSIGADTFYITSTNGESFSPVLQSTGDSDPSDNDAKQNRAHISKQSQPEACPLLQYLPIGSENYPIARALANRDSIFILKPGEGVYRISGTDVTNFNVSLFDTSVNLIAPESATVIGNEVFCFSDQGVVAISENGVRIVSHLNIEEELLRVSQFPIFRNDSFAVSYESDRKFILFVPTESTDTYPTQGFIYNLLTNAWTRWPLSRTCGIVSKYDDKLYLGVPDDTEPSVYKERKNYNRTDYADDEIEVTVSSYSGLTITLTDTTGIEEGDLIKQGYVEAIVDSVDSATVLTLDRAEFWVAGAATVYGAISCDIEWVPNTATNPGMLKHYAEATFFFKEANFSTVQVGFQSNFLDGFQIETLENISGQGWGEFPWGERPWGIPGGKTGSLRTYVPLEYQRAAWINFKVKNREAYSNFSAAGVRAEFEPMSGRMR